MIDWVKTGQAVIPETIKQRSTQDQSVTFPWWQTFNRITGGFRPRELSILCGSTGAGKSTLIANMSAQLCEQNIKHLVFSVEIGPHEFMERVYSAELAYDFCSVDTYTDSIRKKIDFEKMPSLKTSACKVALYENRIPVESLVTHIREAVDTGHKIVFLDNLNFFLNIVSAQDSLIEMDRVVHTLIMLCKELPVHLVLVCHPRKTDSTHVNSIMDVKGSSTAIQEAQNVFLFNRFDQSVIDENEVYRYRRKLTFGKMRRRGMYTGESMVFESRQTRYSEVAAPERL